MSRLTASLDAGHRYSDAHDVFRRADESEEEDTLGSDDEGEPAVRIIPNEGQPSPLRAYIIRAIALLCACSLSIGSHYASYILGPLKSRLAREMGTNNTEFSLLISAFSLNSTWTPLVGGLLASRLGTTTTSILATGVIFLGQALLLFGNLTNSVRLMTFGMWVYGLGVSPLAVVQETIIVRFFKSHGLGVSLALGLVAGKGASFVSARTSYSLSENFGPHAPFYASTLLTAISFLVNIIYVCVSKWLVRESGTELEASELRDEAENTQICLTEAEALKKVAKKRMVYLRDITKLGDVFWAYIGLNILCGAIWAPFTHLAANIIEKRYGLTERDASIKGSYLLAGSVALYPVTGFLVDRVKRRGFVMQLLTASSMLTLVCYAWLALPPSWTKSPMPGIMAFASGHGFSPLLLVVIVPRLVPAKYVSTTLGAHKALEQVGSTAFQTLAGVALDFTKKKHAEFTGPTGGDTRRDIQLVLNAFVLLNVLQLVSIFGLAWLDRKRRGSASQRQSALLSAVQSEVAAEEDDERAAETAKGKERAGAVWRIDNMSSSRECSRGPSCCRASSSDEVASVPLLHDHSRHPSHRESRYVIAPLAPSTPPAPPYLRRSKAVLRRGEIFAAMSAMAIFFAWALFLGTAFMRLRSKEERGSAGVS
ncbi:major facilitator superfamily domain-containing protein [Fomitopsis serialis]|uniref:major facilitator superfamily domain-containing protein n=1 Tax=Fomitopsis serialis TaxID=139415 RepID=UPI002007F06F|nr:major facilitator superfamily domain-containing protein [Neoantrodia serialis]KAH9937670.1 major facilitator superfamily domain-containing protein [Neoantrodia serialis]